MNIILFSKFLEDHNEKDLIERAHELDINGYDLCVRPGYLVNPENIKEKLPQLCNILKKEDLSVQMITGDTDLLYFNHPTAETILSAMDDSNVRLIKLGYLRYNPGRDNYWDNVKEVRNALKDWQKLGEKYNVKICYHTHSGNMMGLNCSSLMHLIKGFDPRYIGAYIDPGHMVINGEPLELGLDVVKDYLSIISLKDSYIFRVDNVIGSGLTLPEGDCKKEFRTAGNGMVPWSKFFNELVRIDYKGPLSVHAEYKIEDRKEFLESLKYEVSYFKKKRDQALMSKKSYKNGKVI